jgi:tRNA modification GTPase
MIHQDTIIALATPTGVGAIGVIRLSGDRSIPITSKIFKSKSGKALEDQSTHTVHFGDIVDGERIIDEVLVTLFKNPHSYTGENVVEISCHGSPYIQQEIIQLALRNGCRMAGPGGPS